MSNDWAKKISEKNRARDAERAKARAEERVKQLTGDDPNQEESVGVEEDPDVVAEMQAAAEDYMHDQGWIATDKPGEFRKIFGVGDGTQQPRPFPFPPQQPPAFPSPVLTSEQQALLDSLSQPRPFPFPPQQPPTLAILQELRYMADQIDKQVGAKSGYDAIGLIEDRITQLLRGGW